MAVPLDDLPTLRTAVLVVGAGPTGLMAALVLHRTGVPVLVIDQKAGPTRESRAVAVQARSMEIYAQLGLAGYVLADSHLATRFQAATSSNASLVGIAKLQDNDTLYPGLRVFEQSKNESLLADTLVAEGVQVLWRHELTALLTGTRSSDTGTEALVTGPNGLLRIRAEWCIGADGSQSRVRSATRATFDGVTDEGAFWVADTHVAAGLVPGAISVRMGRELLTLAFPMSDDGDFRLIGLRTDEMSTQERVVDRLYTEFGFELDEVRWFSTYRIHHRLASTFREGRVFLAGDAAHVHSPVGGQGMNTGLQDAHNLALLLADVHHGRSTATALDRYEAERRPVAATLVATTDRAFGLVARADARVGLLRRVGVNTIFPLVARLSGTRLGARLGGYLGQYRIRYHFAEQGAQTEQTPAWAGDPIVGLRLPPHDGNHLALTSMRWQLHVYGTTDSPHPGEPARSRVSRPEVPEWIDGPLTFRADPRRRLRSERMYLIRPDGFVAAAVPISRGRAAPTPLRSALEAHHLGRL